MTTTKTPTPEVIASLKHWFRMRRFVRQLIREGKGSEYPLSTGMLLKIYEYWGGRYCALCIAVDDCTLCPLWKNRNCCHNYKSAYNYVVFAKKWLHWLTASDGMIRALWDCRYIPIG